MMAQHRLRVRCLRLLGKTLLGLLLVCCLTDLACSADRPATIYDVTQRRLDLIPAGTVIGDKPPRGWTNLILKSYPRPGAGDRKELSATADRLARLLFTALLADVEPVKTSGGQRWKLAKVAVGLGTRIGERDTIITPETHRGLGASLGLFGPIVLSTGQEKLADILIVARSATMLVFDSPGMMLRRQRHRPIVLRYAVLVEGRTGRLETLLWVLDREERGTFSGPTDPIRWLPHNLLGDCILHVDAGEFSLGQPTEKAFAMTDAPKGQKEIAADDDLKPLLARRRFSTALAADLEAKLRQALAHAAEK
jgi:hypothetical protein